MNIPKAIEIKEAYHKRFRKHMLSKEREADRLSIEALKRLVDPLYQSGEFGRNLLPSETKD